MAREYEIVGVKRGDLGRITRMEIQTPRRTNSPWKARHRGCAYYCHNDGLCDVYEVVLDGHVLGIVEDYGNRVVPFPDLDDVNDKLFSLVVGAICTL